MTIKLLTHTSINFSGLLESHIFPRHWDSRLNLQIYHQQFKMAAITALHILDLEWWVY
jgi:hypothetical protein